MASANQHWKIIEFGDVFSWEAVLSLFVDQLNNRTRQTAELRVVGVYESEDRDAHELSGWFCIWISRFGIINLWYISLFVRHFVREDGLATDCHKPSNALFDRVWNQPWFSSMGSLVSEEGLFKSVNHYHINSCAIKDQTEMSFTFFGEAMQWFGPHYELHELKNPFGVAAAFDGLLDLGQKGEAVTKLFFKKRMSHS